MTSDGLCLIAYGNRAEDASKRCLESFLRFHDLSSCVTGWRTPGVESPRVFDQVQMSRWAKVTLPAWSPFDYTLYLDADTVVLGDLSVGFELLKDGWDFVITTSEHQGRDVLWHIDDDERMRTLLEYGCDPLQLQGGVFWFRRNISVLRFFYYWRTEWLRYARFDQAALLRALRYNPIRLYLLGRPFNGGAVVRHNFGEAT